MEKTYRLVVSGKTFPIREELKSWAFQWDSSTKTWSRDCVSEFERRQFECLVEHGHWGDSELVFTEEKPEPWEKNLKDSIDGWQDD